MTQNIVDIDMSSNRTQQSHSPAQPPVAERLHYPYKAYATQANSGRIRFIETETGPEG